MMCCGSASREAAPNASWNPRMRRSAGTAPSLPAPPRPGEPEATSAGFDQAGGGVVAGMHVVNDDTVDAGAPEPLAEEDERCCAPFRFDPLQVDRERTEQDTVGEDGAESRCHP